MLEDIDVTSVLIVNPPEFFKSCAIAISGGFLLIVGVLTFNFFITERKTRKITTRIGVDDDL